MWYNHWYILGKRSQSAFDSNALKENVWKKMFAEFATVITLLVILHKTKSQPRASCLTNGFLLFCSAKLYQCFHEQLFGAIYYMSAHLHLWFNRNPLTCTEMANGYLRTEKKNLCTKPLTFKMRYMRKI